MLTTRAPFRLTLGGGGTDLPSYYSIYGGFSITAAIDKYVYITAHERFDPGLRVSYSKTEIVDTAVHLEHPIVREALKHLGAFDHLELVSIADLPARTGLGSSGAFCVALLKALHEYKGEQSSPNDLAEEACRIAIEILREPSGKQDEYTAAFGGINSYAISMDGKVIVSPLRVSRATVSEMESELLLFYTGITRESRMVLESQSKAAISGAEDTIQGLHKIKQIGLDSKNALEDGNLKEFGRLLDDHWKTKKAMAPRATTSEIDAIYDFAMKNGATGGKIMGAGGGGFFMFHCDKDRRNLTQLLEQHGLRRMNFRTEFEGAKTVIDI
jgi:D-glycero-alpha-D-manno-heptose-7-phosphate kinase